jgi:hypothetical protein
MLRQPGGGRTLRKIPISFNSQPKAYWIHRQLNSLYACG